MLTESKIGLLLLTLAVILLIFMQLGLFGVYEFIESISLWTESVAVPIAILILASNYWLLRKRVDRIEDLLSQILDKLNMDNPYEK